MAEAIAETLRVLELRLLRCSLSPPEGNTTNGSTSTEPVEKSLLALTEEIVSLIEKGNYMEALSSRASRLVFAFADSWDFEDSIDCAEWFYCEAEKSAEHFLRIGPETHLSSSEVEDDMNRCCRALLLMCIGVAAFLVFTQCNVTGPCEQFPSFPLPFWPSKDVKDTTNGGQWEMWARNQLMSTGSAFLGKISAVQYIVYSKMLLVKIKDLSIEMENSSWDGPRSVLWWLSRLLLFQQRILDELSSSLFDLLQVFKGQTLHHFGELEKVESYWGSKLQVGEALTIVSMAHLEAGIIEHAYGRVDISRQHFESAEEASGLQLSVTGVLGFRTLHQVEAKAQTVLVTNTNMLKTGDVWPTESVKLKKSVSIEEDKVDLHSHETQDASDILRAPRLLNNGKDTAIGANDTHDNGIAAIPLQADQQLVALAYCLLIEKSTPYGEMQRWEMAPYIEAVDAQTISSFMIRCFCDILRIRWESTRSRTKERALIMMDKLVQGVYEASPRVAQRICYSYGVYVPPIPALKKEYGELLVGCGMIGEALKIFDDLELWDNLIYCYCLLEKKAAAVELIKARLCEMPNDPRLWCSLGDVTNSESYYEKALEVSNDKSARAKRSLARSAYNKGDYEASKILWESAMALNSLYPDGWFALGAAALKARDIGRALDAFTRAVQLDPDNGEAWNNIACLHMIKKKSKEAFIAFKEALKFRRNSWQLWENYSQVALDTGNFSQALEATKMVLDLTSNKRIDADLLERIMIEMESRTSKPSLSPNAGSADVTAASPAPSGNDNYNEYLSYGEPNLSRSRETDHLVELLGEVLKKIVRSGKGEDIWGLYARWHKIKGNLTMCSEALLKQVRSYQGADLWSNRDRFKKFANASVQLCEVYMEISLSTVSRRELNTAEMHLRNSIRQAVSFSETEEFKTLQACLDEVKKRLQDA